MGWVDGAGVQDRATTQAQQPSVPDGGFHWPTWDDELDPSTALISSCSLPGLPTARRLTSGYLIESGGYARQIHSREEQ
ncbi:hypothetical protein HYQ46_006433 [Verticillium longisporum]|nr:hypothetical protein HYQ46_006433 [Verticillium longisporum]